MKLLAFAASHRKESINRKLAQEAARHARAQGASVDFREYGAFDTPVYDDETCSPDSLPSAVAGFIDALNTVNGVMISVPEYNWSFPGSLKNLIDWVSIATPMPLKNKPFLLLSATPSLRGGAQGLVQLRAPLSALGCHVFPRLFTLSLADTLWTENHQLKDQKISRDLQQTVQDFIAFTNALS